MMLKILKEKKGASMIFVLCVMLLLMSVCASVIVAASASAGAATNRVFHNRLVIGADSIHKNVMYSLQNDDGNPDDQLWGQLLMAVYEANDNGGTGLEDITDVEISFSSGRVPDTLEIEPLIFSFPKDRQNVNIYPAIEEIPEAGTPRVPKTAEVSATLFVTSKVKSGEKTLTTVSAYEFTGGKLSDFDSDAPQTGGPMTVINPGKWRLISYENQNS